MDMRDLILLRALNGGSSTEDFPAIKEAEAKRVVAENERVQNETQRVNAEKTRAQDFESLSNNLKDAIASTDDIIYQGTEEPTDPNTKVWIDTDGTVAGEDKSLGITDAQVGQIIKVKEIDASGRPVLWEALDQETFYPIVEMTEPTAELAPNKFYKWGEAATLNITLGAEKPGVTNEFIFEFISGTEPTNLSVPGNVKWATPLKVEANKKYQVSILNGIGVIGGA